jgi:UDP-glucose 4-epimerase
MTDSTDNYSGKRVAITGANGYIAGSLVEMLKNSNTSVLRVSRNPLPLIHGTNTLQTDLNELDSWLTIISESDIIFHLSGNTSIYAAADDPVSSLRTSLFPVLQLIKAAKKINKKPRVVFASTVTLYGFPENHPVDEMFLTVPVTVYDLHKLFAEQQLKLASTNGVIEYVSLRLANVYGPSSGSSSSNDRGILNRQVKQAMEGGNLKIYGTGEYIRDYIYIEDVARAFLTAGLATGIDGNVFNISSGEGITIADVFIQVAHQVENNNGIKVPIEYVDWPASADPLEQRDFVGSHDKFYRMTGWKPQKNLEQGIDSLISYYSELH